MQRCFHYNEDDGRQSIVEAEDNGADDVSKSRYGQLPLDAKRLANFLSYSIGHGLLNTPKLCERHG